MTLLDLPARSILDLSTEAGEARYLLTAGVAEVSGRNPAEITTSYHRAAEETGGTVRDALAAMGAPATVAEAIQMLERSRDELRSHAAAKQKELERAGAAAEPMSVEARADALEHPTKRWLEAKAKGIEGDDREAWIEHDRLLLESGRDQLADFAAADAERELTASVRLLDSALAQGRREGIRTGRGTRALDAAISQARSEKISLAAGPLTGVRTLVADTPLDRAQRRLAAEGKDCTNGRLLLDAMIAEDRQLDAPPAPDDPFPAVKLKPGIDVRADFADRLRRARLVSTRYDGPSGEARFKEDDLKREAEGVDLVAGLEQRRREWVQRGVINPVGRVG
jgi:hypothetical protein